MDSLAESPRGDGFLEPIVLMRSIRHTYSDPLSALWHNAAKRLGLDVTYSQDVFASTNGKGVLTLASTDRDSDDCDAQMIFHELCHSLVAGPESFKKSDWGLSNEDNRHELAERACIRVQYILARQHGLDQVLAPTTDFRLLYDQFTDAILDDRSAPENQLAIRALRRLGKPPWNHILQETLVQTRGLIQAALPGMPPNHLFHGLSEPQPKRADRKCGDCAWFKPGQCLQERNVTELSEACWGWEAPSECVHCGACCRESFDVVEVSSSDPTIQKHPELFEKVKNVTRLKRTNTHCSALSLSENPSQYICRIYEDRPQLCRDFTQGSANCLLARRRANLSIVFTDS